MIMKKLIFIAIIIILFNLFLFSDKKNNLNKNKIQNNNLSNKFTGFINNNSLLITSDNLNQENSLKKFIYYKNTIKDIINNDISVSEIEPDFIIISSFINSLYYLIKFKINLWAYNQSIFFENNNKIKPYFNINLKNKIINIVFDINL